MAGDWIKMRMGLSTHPKVVRIASALKADRYRVIGALHAVWCLADEHTADGILDGYSMQALDDSINWPGFSQAMSDVAWLEVNGKGLLIPRFDEHNGVSAKRRALDAERKRRDRVSAPEADGVRTREEKEEEKKVTTEIGALGIELLPSNIPYKEIVTLFNEHMGQLPMVRELTLKRRQLIRAAWQASKVRRELKFWKAYFEEAQDDPFLNGTGPYGKGHENWRPTFDYLMRNEVITKTYEKAMSR